MRLIVTNAWNRAVLAAILGVVSIACDSGRVIKNETTVTFVFPSDGAAVGPSDDVNASASGIQVNVEVSVTGIANGARLVLTNDREKDSTGAPVPTEARVDNKVVRFPGYTLPMGQVRLRAALPSVSSTAACNGGECAEVAITVVVSDCQFTTPRHGDELVASDEDPTYVDDSNPYDPFEVDVVLDCSGANAGEPVTLSVNGGLPIDSTMDTLGRVTFPRVALAEGANALKAIPYMGTVPGSAVQGTVTVSTGRCTAELLPIDGSSLLAKDDFDLNPATGMQATLHLVTDCLNVPEATVRIFVKGPADATFNSVTVPASIPTDRPDGRINLRLDGVLLPQSVTQHDVVVVGRVDESGGRYGLTLATHYSVDSQPPSLITFSPSAGACVGPMQDAYGDLLDGIQIDAYGLASGATRAWAHAYSDNEPETLCDTDDDCTSPQVCYEDACRNTGVVGADGRFTIAALSLPTGEATLEYVVGDAAGNRSGFASAAIDVFDTSPTVAITQITTPTRVIAPADGASLGRNDDANLAVASLQTTLRLELTDVPFNATGTILISGQSPVSFSPQAGATVQVNQSITLTDGIHTIQARVKDPCGNDIESTQIQVTVFANVRDLAVLAYAADNSVCTVHDQPACVTAPAPGCMWNATAGQGECVAGFAAREPLVDSSTVGGTTPTIDLDVVTGTGVAGAPRVLSISAYDDVDVSTTTRLCTGTENTLQGVTVAPTETGALLTDLPLASGINCFAIVVDDGINQLTTTYVINQRTTTPTLTIASPAAGDLDTDSNGSLPGFNYDVVINLNAPYDVDGNDIDGTVTLQVRTAAAGSTLLYALTRPLAAGLATTTFIDASLPSGAIQLVATYTDTFGNTSSSTAVAVTVAGYPAIVISAPAQGSSLNNTHFAVEVTYLGTDTPASFACDLYVDNAVDNGTPFTWTTPASTPLTVDTAAALGDGTHLIRVECDTTGVTQTISVDIDETPPPAPTLVNEQAGTPGRLIFDSPPATTAYVNASVSDDAAQAGLQHAVRVLVSPGSEDPVGWTIALTVTAPNSAPVIYRRLVTAPDNPILTTFTGVDFGLDEGQITFSAVVIDRAGNPSTPPTEATLTIDRTPPVLTQTKPAVTQLTITGSDDETPGDINYLDISFTYTVSGAAPGSNVSLWIDPAPFNIDHEPMSALDFPLLVPVATSTLVFPRVAFRDDGRYTAIARVSDEAGNVSEIQYTFDVVVREVRIEWAGPNSGGNLNLSNDTRPDLSGFQGTFAYNVFGFASGTTVHLCSSVQVTGFEPACRWGSDGTLGGPNTGYLMGAGVTNVSNLSGVVMQYVGIGDGEVVLHAEAQGAGGTPDVYSPFFTFFVDATPPVVESIVFEQNDVDNDPDDRLLLGGSEGTVGGSRLTTEVTVTVSGSAEGRQVRLLSNRPVANTLVGTATLDGSGSATFNVALNEGLQAVRATVTDAANNPNSPSTDTVASVTVAVDITKGSVSIAPPQFAPRPYTSATGTVNGDSLEVDVVVTVSDNEILIGGKVTLEQFAVDAGGTARTTVEQTLATDVSQVTFGGFALGQGLNYLEATFLDAAGNVAATTTRELYPADFKGPALTLEAWDTTALLTCTEASPCAADYLDPTTNGYRAVLDETRLLFSLTGCNNSDDSIELCGAGSTISVRLESRITAAGPVFSSVFGSTYGEQGDVAAGTDFATKAAGFAFDAGAIREVRVAAMDLNGNVSYSNSVFMQFDLEGLSVSISRLDAAMQPVQALADDLYWGVAENRTTGAGFAADLRVVVTALGASPPVPTQVCLSVDVSSYNVTQGIGSLDFIDVGFQHTTNPASPIWNEVSVIVDCGVGACGDSPCGGVSYKHIVADIDPPTYEFNRCDLCALGVPLVGAELCGSCGSLGGNDQANIADLPSVALWNAAKDQDGNPANGFSILGSTQPLTVQITGLEDGELVTLGSDSGSLTGATVLSTGCEPATNCRAVYGNLHLPSLAGEDAHALTVSFTDRAGNAAVPVVGRGSETIHARTDVLAPGGVQATVCIGESTTPYDVTSPESDPKTYEDPSCTAICADSGACDRRGGSVTLSWQAPREDGLTGGQVASYDIVVAAINVNYPNGAGTHYPSCAAVNASGDVEILAQLTATAAPDGNETYVVEGLFPHRSYCFGVLAVDDMGNRITLADSVVERTLPLITYPNIVEFDPINPNDGPPEASLFTGIAGIGKDMTNVGDVDGDGRDDFVVYSSLMSLVHVFISSNSVTEPFVTIDGTTMEASSLGRSVAGGDFDADGYSDIAICAPSVNSNAGALYLYYGIPGVGIRTDANDPLDSDFPSIVPDVAVFGSAADDRFCRGVAMGDVDGQISSGRSSDDLVVADTNSGNYKRVHGFLGGSRNRFPSQKIHLVFDVTPGPGFSNRPNFSLQGKTVGRFPWIPPALADVNGDGRKDIVVADNGANHDSVGTCNGCGEVYIWAGRDGISGLFARPDDVSPLHTLRYVSPLTNFGQTLLTIEQPRLAAGDSADWIAVQSASGSGRVVVFEATALGSNPGVVPAIFPAGGLAQEEYKTLDWTTWLGASLPAVGYAMAFLGEFDQHGGVDIAIGPGHSVNPGAYGVTLFSLDPTVGKFVKRAIFYGGPSFGTALVGLNNSLETPNAGTVQLGISSRTAGEVYLFH